MNESLNQFDAQSANDLICKLQSYDTCIPNRSSGRKTHHTERWTICRFLHAIANTSVLSYPLCVKHGDRPDLVLGFSQGISSRIGIEIVEAVPQSYAHLQSKFEQEDSVDVYPVPEIKFHDPPWSKKRVENYVKSTKRGRLPPPIMGDRVERNWKEAIIGFVIKKAKKYESNVIKRYPRNWLLIYDNWSVAPPNWEVQRIIKELHQCLYTSELQNLFDRVFVMRCELVWELIKPSQHSLRCPFSQKIRQYSVSVDNVLCDS